MMGWMIFGAFLIVVYFGLWALMLMDAGEDTESVERYERERAAFEEMFE